MRKDAPPMTDLPTAQVNESMQNSMDSFGNIYMAPVRKLDADEYTANDLDGVTESATGSGNLNFLMMQAGQTNEAISNLNPFDIAGGDTLHFNALNGAASGFAPLPGTDNGFDTAMDRGFDGLNEHDGQGNLNNVGNTSSNAGSLGASNFAANAAGVNPLSSVANFDSSSATETGGPPAPPVNGTNGMNGTGGTDGSSGIDGSNGTDGTGTTIINNTTLIDESLYETIEHILNESTTNLGDVINDATTNLYDTINNTSNTLTEIINNITGGNGLGPIGLNLGSTVDGTSGITLDLINGDMITNVLDETFDTTPVLDPLSGLVGDLLSDTDFNFLINPFQPDTGANDSDLHIGTGLELLGIQLPDQGFDVPLDIVEPLLGDIDIGLGLSNDLLGGLPVLGDILGGSGNGDTDFALGGMGALLNAAQMNGTAETLLNPVENLIGDVDLGGTVGLGLLGLDSGQTGSDTDITTPLDIDIIDSELLNNTLGISLDPLENIIGDVDLDLGAGGDILGQIADPVFDGMLGGNGQNDLLAQAGGGLSGLTGDILPIGNSADTDVSLDTGIGLLDDGLVDNGLDLILNPVEDLTGDIDIGADIGFGLLGTADTGAADTDISVPFDIAFIDNPLLNDGIELSLDPVENLIGDIDITSGVATDLMHQIANPMFDDAEGGSGTDNLLSFVGDSSSDIFAPVAEGSNDLMDPLSPAIGDTIDNLDVLGDADLGGLGSLTGGIDDITNGLGLDGLLGGDGGLTETIDTAIGLIDSSAPSTGGLDLGAITGGLSDGTDPLGTITAWTETILPNAGDLLGGGLAVDPVASIPDPVLTTPVLSLPPVPAVPSVPLLGGGLLGGLGGNHGHGGLFG